VPWVSAKDMKQLFIDDAEDHISEEGLQAGSKLAERGDVLLLTRGMTLLKDVPIGVVRRPVAFNQDVKAIRSSSDRLAPEFLPYLLLGNKQALQDSVDQAGHGTGRISTDLLLALPVRLPPVELQLKLAANLRAMDDRIALNHAMNQTLEDIARAVFKSWFIDFDPVHAKAEGKATGLPPEIDALFPSEFEETEEGVVPGGWPSVPLREQVEVTRGLSYSGAGLGEPGEGVPMHNLNSIYEGGGYKTAGLKWFTGDFKERHIAKPGDVLVANTEQGFDRLLIGSPALVPDAWDGPTIFSHHLYKVDPKPDARVTRDYMAYWLKDRTLHDWVSGFANGTTVNMLPKDALEMPDIVLPPHGLIAALGHMVRAFHAKMELNEKQAASLGELRDLLLPKLISGELQVPHEVVA